MTAQKSRDLCPISPLLFVLKKLQFNDVSRFVRFPELVTVNAVGCYDKLYAYKRREYIYI